MTFKVGDRVVVVNEGRAAGFAGHTKIVHVTAGGAGLTATGEPYSVETGAHLLGRGRKILPADSLPALEAEAKSVFQRATMEHLRPSGTTEGQIDSLDVMVATLGQYRDRLASIVAAIRAAGRNDQ